MKSFNSILYMFSNMDSSSQILLFLIILVSLMLVSILVINYIEKKKNDRMLKGVKISKKISTIKQQINTANEDIKPNINLKTNKVNEVKENIEKIEELNIKEEISKIETIEEKEVEEVVKVVPKRTSIDDIAKLMEDTLEQEPINLTEFEEDQEENAIISYDELVKRAGAKKIVYKYEEVEVLNDPEEKIVETSLNNEPKKFKASKVISPVFGIQKEKEEKDEVLESFIDLEDLGLNNSENSELEETKNMDFLTSLKEFRSGLE